MVSERMFKGWIQKNMGMRVVQNRYEWKRVGETFIQRTVVNDDDDDVDKYMYHN